MPARRITRDVALGALADAASALHVPPRELTMPAYRALRGETPLGERPPSEFTISLLFGGWARACREAAQRLRPEDAAARLGPRASAGRS